MLISLLTSGPAGWGSTTSAPTASPCLSPPTSSECLQSRWMTGRSSVEARRAWSLCGTTGWARSSGRFTPGRPARRCCCDPPSQLLRSLEMVSELELVTAACSDGHHTARVETVMGQTPPSVHSRECCRLQGRFTLKSSGSAKEEFITWTFSSKIQETDTLASRADG